MRNDKGQKTYLEKSLFQDHNNIQAIKFDNLHGNLEADIQILCSYNKNYQYEQDFLSFALAGSFKKTQELMLLDNFLSSILSMKIQDCVCNYKSHRFNFAKSMKFLFCNKFDNALFEIDQAIKIVENSHLQYHQLASEIYAKRSSLFRSEGQKELADNDLVKSRDFINI